MKKNGFTLAEVLITLGILGVIGALTIPALMHNTEKVNYSNGIKTTMNIFTNGLAQMRVLEDVDNLKDSDLWNECLSEEEKEDPETQEKTTEIKFDTTCAEKNLRRYFAITETEAPAEGKNKPSVALYCINNSDCTSILKPYPRFNMANGTAFYLTIENNEDKSHSDCDTIKGNGGSMCGKAGEIFIDVNGDKRPNTFGKDIFAFAIGSNGKLYPFGGKDLYLFNEHPLWKTNCDGKLTDTTTCAADSAFDMTARVIEEGYKFNYY